MLGKRILYYYFLITFIGTVVLACTSRPKQSQAKKQNANIENNNTKKQPQKTPIKVPQKKEVLRVNFPPIKREFRAVWIASVANINWPSRKDLSTEQQKAEAIYLLDMLKENNFNAVILQVRPSGDALYESALEPWSYFLTGEIGKRPYPYYDPLQFWIDEAHKRGLELHAWLNPYRVHHSNGGKVTSASLVNQFPDYIVRLRNGMYWFDPSDQRTQDHVSAVIHDLINRYDIDGIHFDDYFYPYANYNGGADFPDCKTWTQYKNSGGTLSKADWRRENVNTFVERIYKEIKAQKNSVLFGISPFGIWKSGFPADVRGLSQYVELYADAKLWLNNGWVDYFAPQLYWPIASKGQSYTSLLQWWKNENTMHRHLWPGVNTVEIKVPNRPQEILSQIELNRAILSPDPGEIHWNIAGLTRNPLMLSTLTNTVYQQKALIPKSPWLKAEKLETPQLQYIKQNQQVSLNWSSTKLNQVFLWVLYAQYGSSWETTILDKEVTSQTLPLFNNGQPLHAVAIKAIDRLSNESDYTAKKIK